MFHDKQTWQDLKFALDSMQPYVSLLTPGSGRFGLAFQTQHYVERLYALYEADERALADLGILESLEKVNNVLCCYIAFYCKSQKYISMGNE